MPGIFISYRNIKRSYAPMLIDRELSRRFGPENVFQAGRSNVPATHFPSQIERWLEGCSVLIALIDPPWVNEDLRLLEDPKDWVRREIAYALRHGKEVLPVLLDGVEMPKTRQLPGDVASLTHHIGLRMESATADTDLLRLIGEVERLAPDLVLANLMDPALPAPADPAALLRAEHEVLPFRPRPELDRLVEWCRHDTGSPAALVTGVLGAGKTRLGLHLTTRLRGFGWSAGLLSVSAPPEALERLGETRLPSLVVIDDAEARPDHVRAALRSLATAPGMSSRLLLLARAGGDWLDRLRDDRDDGVAALAGLLRPLPLEALRPAEGDLRAACTAFAERLRLPPLAPPPAVPATMLEMQAAALTHVLPSHGPAEPPLRRILQLEREYWSRTAALFGLPAGRSTIAELMAAVTLFGASTEPEANDLLRALRMFREAPVSLLDSGRDFLRTVLPGPAPLNPLRPEQLGENQLADHLRSHHSLPDVLDRVSDRQAGAALLTLGRCLDRHPDLAGAVEAFLGAAPYRLLPLAMTALPAVPRPELLVASMSATLDRLPAAELDPIVTALPQRSEALARFAVVATERLLTARRSAGLDDTATARLARLFAVRLVYLGERATDAAEAARAAIARLTASAGVEERAELAESYAALALALDLTPGSAEEAMTAGEAAIDAYRTLPEEDRYTAALATTSHNQSVRLRHGRRIEEALSAASTAHTLIGPLHRTRPARFRSLYADVQENLATLHHLTGRSAEAERLGRDTLALRRTLAAARPDAYRPQLAGTLYNLGLIRSDRGDPAEATMLWTEALSIFEALAAQRPDRFGDERDRVRARLSGHRQPPTPDDAGERGRCPMTLMDETRMHYEAFPFIEGGRRRVRHWKRRLGEPLPDGVLADAAVLDVGCGSGEVAQGLAERGAQVICVDLTAAAVRRARRRMPGILACQAGALTLPFSDAAVDHAVSIGVLHHTPDAFRGLAEMVRVTRPGGRVVVMLYARWTPYHLVYRLSAPLRARVPVTWLGRMPRLPLHVMRLVVAAQVGQWYGDDQLRRLLADQLWTPRASFQSARRIRRWAASLGLVEVRRHALLCHGNLFTFQVPADVRG
ncbi:methyltransferase domain-containing protein [Actinomadura scrupuli]|uniref:methyltransferase domain-containing protein n=1 Tax=Actinomadura scrupuli TaxID=559629 RepID=UPI003D96610B